MTEKRPSLFGRWGLQPLRMHARAFRASAPEAGISVVKHLAFLGLLVALTASLLFPVHVAAQSARAKAVGMHIKCLCKGCDMTAGGCAHPGGAFSGPCETAKAQLKEIDEHLANNESEQQIIDAFVAKYGTIAYVEPPKHGFGLVAWLMPISYSVLGLAVVVLVVRKWAHRKPAAVPAGPPPTTLRAELLERARAQAARDTED